jgi:hypothetical protein
MKTLREMMDIIESAQTVTEGIPNDLTPYEAGEADGLSGEPYENPYPEGSESYTEFRQGWRAGYSESKQEEIEETELDPIRRVEELFRDRH